MQKETDNWFASWFDTPYYHILYKDRGYTEAALFMNALSSFLELSPKDEILDLACGKGRHSRYLHTLGYKVTGVDLSPASIAYAKQFEEENLQFEVHDMCLPFPKKFDAVFNLFTSFGYFESEFDNLRTIKAIKEELKPEGHGVIDFLNTELVIKNLVASEAKEVDGIHFYIQRKIENDYIIKEIRFTDQGEHYHFTEKVKALTLEDFMGYFKEAGVTLQHHFGNYKLEPFHAPTSERLILVFN